MIIEPHRLGDGNLCKSIANGSLAVEDGAPSGSLDRHVWKYPSLKVGFFIVKLVTSDLF
jgi:hypothetical protein